MRSFDDLMARYSPSFRPITSLVPLDGGGGSSGARLWRFRAEHGNLLLRAWPLTGPGRTQIERIHHWLFQTADLGFVPVPIRDRAGQSLQEWRDLLWEITPWMPGAADRSPPTALAHVRVAFSGLAAFHQRLAGEQVEAVSAGLRQRQDEIARLIGGGFDSLDGAIRCHVESPPSNKDKALAWMVLARRVAPDALEPLVRESGRSVRIQPVLRDARPEHFLFEDDQLSGLIDFGAMGIETVATDLARLIGDWFDGEPSARREALSAYEQIRPLDPGEARLIPVFETTTALLIGERWARWHYVENRHFDDPDAVSKGLDRGLSRLERLARELYGTRRFS
jgi:Ser/Thr protein kinase RdoA (MazF antagonist)